MQADSLTDSKKWVKGFFLVRLQNGSQYMVTVQKRSRYGKKENFWNIYRTITPFSTAENRIFEVYTVEKAVFIRSRTGFLRFVP